MAKYYVRMEHGLIDGPMTFDTSATVEAGDIETAIALLLRSGIGERHEIKSICATVIGDEPKTGGAA